VKNVLPRFDRFVTWAKALMPRLERMLILKHLFPETACLPGFVACRVHDEIVDTVTASDVTHTAKAGDSSAMADSENVDINSAVARLVDI